MFQDEHFNLGDDTVRANIFSTNDGFLASLCAIASIYAASLGSLDTVVCNSHTTLPTISHHHHPSPQVSACLIAALAIGVKGGCSYWITSHLQNEREKEELEKEAHHLRRYPDEEEDHLMELLSRQVCSFSEETRVAIHRDLNEQQGEQRSEMNLRIHAALELGINTEREDEDPTFDSVVGSLWQTLGSILPLLPWVLPFTSTVPLAFICTGALSALFVAFMGITISQFTLQPASRTVPQQIVVFSLCAVMSYMCGWIVHYLATHTINITTAGEMFI